MPIILESNEELHQRLIQRSKDRQREEYIAVLHTRQYPLPVVLLKIVISYLPGYFMHWLPSGELIFKQEMSLSKPMWNYVIPTSQIKYDDDNDDNDSCSDDYDDEYADYENKYNPESDD
jgi:hypothetical protein